MSAPLNINEGMYSGGKNRGARLTNAMASAKPGDPPSIAFAGGSLG
jgi:hypothetical protein